MNETIGLRGEVAELERQLQAGGLSALALDAWRIRFSVMEPRVRSLAAVALVDLALRFERRTEHCPEIVLSQLVLLVASMVGSAAKAAALVEERAELGHALRFESRHESHAPSF